MKNGGISEKSATAEKGNGASEKSLRATVGKGSGASEKFSRAAGTSAEAVEKSNEAGEKSNETGGKPARARMQEIVSVDLSSGGVPRDLADGITVLLRCSHTDRDDISDTEERYYHRYRAALVGDHDLILQTPEMPDFAAERGIVGGRNEFSARGSAELRRLSMRGVRGSLAFPSVFGAQLRAALRLSAVRRLSLLVPFVSTPEEMRDTHRATERAMRALLARGEPFDELTGVGALIETPAAAMNSREIAAESDFLFIGTDNLFALALGACGHTPTAESLFAAGREALLRLCAVAVSNAHAVGRFVGISGSFAADPALRDRFVEMDADAIVK